MGESGGDAKIRLTILIEGGREYQGEFDRADEIIVVRHIAMRAMGVPSQEFPNYELRLSERTLDEMKRLGELEIPEGAVIFLKRK
jgi:hypothetical protein